MYEYATGPNIMLSCLKMSSFAGTSASVVNTGRFFAIVMLVSPESSLLSTNPSLTVDFISPLMVTYSDVFLSSFYFLFSPRLSVFVRGSDTISTISSVLSFPLADNGRHIASITHIIHNRLLINSSCFTKQTVCFAGGLKILNLTH